jgi:glutamine amidotransferase
MPRAKPSVVVVDHGSGNLRSAERALARVGADVVVSADVALAADADGVVLPGVGAFAACMAGVREVKADALVRDRVSAGRPVLGICVGMQVMYDAGDEHGVRTDGIGVVRGEVTRLGAPILPHMGWNTVTPPDGSSLFAGLGAERFYFVHSYGVRPAGAGLETVTVHGEAFVSAIEAGPVAATPFHPEKSGEAGLALLENWLRSLS